MPARQKFLRTPQTEMGHVTEQLARIALVHPEIEFRLTHNGRLVHHLRPAQSMRARIADFYGRDLADTLLEIARDERGLRIEGYTAPPAHSRSSSKWQYLFLNGRYIRDRFIAHAVREAYRGLIEAHRHPVVFLAFEIDPAAVDVNVHPTKIEVRWRDSNVIYTQVLSALRDRFLNADLTPDLQADRIGATPRAPDAGQPEFADGKEQRANVTASPAPPGQVGDAEPGLSLSDDERAEHRRRQIRESIADFFKRSRPITPTFRGDASTGRRPSAAPQPPAPDMRALIPTTDISESDGLAGLTDYDNVIQVHRTYLIAESADGVTIVDQHALHERILFEQLSEQITRGPLESQRLLIPETIDVSPDQVAVIEAQADALEQLGFELTPYGTSTIAVHAAPSLLKPERVHEFLRDVLDRLAVRSAPASTEMLTNDLLSMMACKAAVKAGDPLSTQEIQALLAQRHRVDRSSNCPHGRPTSLRLTLSDLERQFKRT